MPETQRSEGRALAMGLGAVLLWSTVASAFKLGLRVLEPLQLLSLASLVALLFLGAVLAAQGRLGELRGLGAARWRRALVLGLVNPFIYYAVLFEAYDRLPAQVAQPLNFTWALVLGLLSVPLLGQRFRWRDLAAGLVCYSGVVVIFTGGSLEGLRGADPLGLALVLGSTLLWALYWIGNRRSDLDPALGLFLNFLVGTPFVLLAALLGPGLTLGGGAGLAGGLYVGIAEMGLAFLLWLGALRRTESTARIANLIFLAPFLSLVFIRLLTGERILASTPLGLALIVAGLLLQQSRTRVKS